MKFSKAKDLMVPLDEYAIVSQEASLFEAIMSLEEAHKEFRQDRCKHRSILVYDENLKIVGKVSLWDVIHGLEPKYKQIADFKSLSRFGLVPAFGKSMMKDFELWQKPLDDLCTRANDIRIKDIMYTPELAEYVHEDTSMNEAVHQFVIGHHQSLLVTGNNGVVGVLRLTDVFAEICHLIKSC